jgi:ribosomal protein S18 acetylase RimI-like enzyme
MNNSPIQFKTKTASVDHLLAHLNSCNLNFTPSLSEKVDLVGYADKIYEKSVTFEAWFNETLVGLIAAYFNNLGDLTGFITNVSVIHEYNGKGIASELLNRTIDYAVKNGFKYICLEVNNKNIQAIKLYQKFNFYITNQKKELIFMKKDI